MKLLNWVLTGRLRAVKFRRIPLFYQNRLLGSAGLFEVTPLAVLLGENTKQGDKIRTYQFHLIRT
jgi:hypothetical protein